MIPQSITQLFGAVLNWCLVQFTNAIMIFRFFSFSLSQMPCVFRAGVQVQGSGGPKGR